MHRLGKQHTHEPVGLNNQIRTIAHVRSIRQSKTGEVTTFSTVVNAMVIVAFLPIALEGWHFHAPAHAQTVAQRPKLFTPPPVVPEQLAAVPRQSSPSNLSSISSQYGQSSQYGPLAPTSPTPPEPAAPMAAPPTDDPLPDDAQRLRLARFLPARAPHAPEGATLDLLLERALSERASRAADLERAAISCA